MALKSLKLFLRFVFNFLFGYNIYLHLKLNHSRNTQRSPNTQNKKTSKYIFSIGLISTKESLQEGEKVSASSFCRRRLPWIMCKLKMAQSLKMATELIQQGNWDFFSF